MEMQELLKLCIDKKASDLHIMPGLPPLLRIFGDLMPAEGMPPLTAEDTKRLGESMMTADEKRTFETDLAVEFQLEAKGISNFRVSVFHQHNGIAAALRVIPDKIPTMEELGLPPILKSLLALSHGLIVVAGSTGSGKSTTLAAMIDHINTNRAAHIITIEDPIEYLHANKKSAINQLQVGRDTHSMDAALRAALRQDPDIILVGEARDLETIRLALSAAETGHLVLTTLHASSAPHSISRIVDVFPTNEKNRIRNVLAESLQGVLYQTLLKRAKGGRVAAFEIMLANAPIRHLVRQDMTTHMETTIQTSGDLGMCSLEQYVQKLLATGVITNATARAMSAKRGTFNE